MQREKDREKLGGFFQYLKGACEQEGEQLLALIVIEKGGMALNLKRGRFR